MNNAAGGYLGLDISLTSPGFCVASDLAPCIQSSHVKSKNMGMKRVEEIFERFSEYLTTFYPKQFLIEGYSYNSKGGKPMDRAELVGVIKFELHRLDLPLIIVPPKKIKKFATGNGNADKSAMILAAYKEFKLEFTCDDEADAFWLAQMGRAVDGHWDGMNRTKVREEIIEELKGGIVKDD